MGIPVYTIMSRCGFSVGPESETMRQHCSAFVVSCFVRDLKNNELNKKNTYFFK